MQNARQTFVDGSLDHDIPMAKLEEMFNVNHFIVSQVNPHVRLALTAEEAFTGNQPTRPWPRKGVMWGIKTFLREELLHRTLQVVDLGSHPGT